LNSPELKIQHDCVVYLRSLGIFCHSVPNEAGGRSKILQTQLVSAGLVAGVADLVVWWPSVSMPTPLPRVYQAYPGYIEIKTQEGSQSERQKVFQKKCIESGIEYAVVRSVEDMKDIVAMHISEDSL
jgi:hypothetical protein